MAFLDSTGLSERQKRSWAKHLNHLLMASTAKALLTLSAAILALLLIASFATAQSDADGDGVEDNDDDCPDTAEGQTVDANGCSEEQRNDGNGSGSSGANSTEEDGDGDGVFDPDDECSDTESGRDVNEVGCATYQMDGDHDGVTNNIDNCPNTPRSERGDVDNHGCTPFFEETFAEDVPLLGRLSNGNAISAGTVSMLLGGVGWAWRAGRVIGVTGGSGKRRKKKFLRRIKKATSTVELQGIRKELNKAYDKSKLPDGAYADLMAAQEQRRIVLSNAPATSEEGENKFNLRPSSKPPQ